MCLLIDQKLVFTNPIVKQHLIMLIKRTRTEISITAVAAFKCDSSGNELLQCNTAAFKQARFTMMIMLELN